MSDNAKVVFYDIPGTSKSAKAWSINMWKTRYVLNYKGIPYQTRWIEYPDIAGHFKSIGMPPSDKSEDGSDEYTCPSIVVSNDGSKPVMITDSKNIAEYLDEHFPQHPLFPYGTKGLQSLFMSQVTASISPLFPLLLNLAFQQLNPESAPYFRRTREARLGKPIEEFCPEGPTRTEALAKVREGLHKLAPYLTKSGDESGVFLLGEEITYADIFLGSTLKFMKTIGETAIWPQIKEWDDGLWGKFSDTIDAKIGQVVE